MKTAKQKSEEIHSPTIGEADTVPPKSSAEDLADLRHLLVHPEKVGEVLPSAIEHSRRKGDKLAKATLQLTEENIRQSVIRNPDVLAEALFPAIGPAIRKAIAEALGQMVQSLNKSLEHSVSPQGMRWRVEAWRTGKSFAEVVMLNSLVYRVEEVFLINRETGGLLQHVSAQTISQDADMVSAMLTAIQDFAHDSFKESENAQLDSLQLNDLSVWIERSPDAILAGVIRGNPPLHLRETFKESIESIQFVQNEDFDEFSGDTTVFEKSRPMLDNCLQFQLSQDKQNNPSIFSPTNILAGLLGLILLVVGFIYVRDYWRWSNYLSRLQTENGIVVVESDLGWFKDSISGLRDPAAIDPDQLLGEYSLQRKYIESVWKPYQDLSPEMVLQRAKTILQPPAGVELKLENGVLTAHGDAPVEWFARAKILSTTIGGINKFRFASDGMIAKLNNQQIRFGCGTLDITDPEKLDSVRQDLELLIESGEKLSVAVRGQTDGSGSAAMNAQISRLRSEKVIAELNKSAKLNEIRDLFKPTTGNTSEHSGCLVDFVVSSETR